MRRMVAEIKNNISVLRRLLRELFSHCFWKAYDFQIWWQCFNGSEQTLVPPLMLSRVIQPRLSHCGADKRLEEIWTRPPGQRGRRELRQTQGQAGLGQAPCHTAPVALNVSSCCHAPALTSAVSLQAHQPGTFVPPQVFMVSVSTTGCSVLRQMQWLITHICCYAEFL